jgi:DNA integrity scanning protein DisA with diadenylate cyclase activity
VRTVARALDVEGDHVVKESTEGVGTRHRSAYRFCNGIIDAIAVVVSQDGNVRWIKWKNGMVTYWDQA